MNKNIAPITLSAYATLVAIGGIIGFLKAGSHASLVAGISSGAILGFLAYGMFKECKVAHKLSTFLTALLGAFFCYRFYLSQAFMPAGLMVILSVLTTIVLISTFCNCKKSCQ